MLYQFFQSLSIDLSSSCLIQIMIRSLIAGIFAYLICFFGTKIFIKKIHKIKLFQPIRDDGVATHIKTKQNTPTMGGLIIIGSALISALILTNFQNPYIIITSFIMISFSLIGFIDDFLKVTQKSAQGFRGSIKLIIQFFIVGISILWLGYHNSLYLYGGISIPFSNLSFELGLFYIIFALIIIVGAGNSVNLTDGLDGLVSVPIILNLLCLIFIIYQTANPYNASQLGITNIPQIEELIIFCAILIGSILAFLKYNLKPAKIFMGDVGSLGLGATLGILAIITKQELVFGIISLLFVIEALSVILQVGSYKIRKKRIFLMAPIHHHFEKLGWGEVKVVRSFWLAALFFAAIGLWGFVS